MECFMRILFLKKEGNVKIRKVAGREIFDSRGNPTVCCEIVLENGRVATASVPSGASRGSGEAFELRDHEQRLGGKGVTKAVYNIEHKIGPALMGQEPDLFEADEIIKDLDDTPDKRNLGANATLAVSIAVCKAQAVAERIELFELIAGLHGVNSISLPFPLINVLNGGAHANNGFPIQEIMLMPMGAANFRASFEAALDVFASLKDLLNKKGKSTAVGDEGGFAPVFSSIHEPFQYLQEALQQSGHEGLFSFAIDVAANQLYDPKIGLYQWGKEHKDSDQLLKVYQELIQNYGLFSIEDGFAEQDLPGWQTLFEQCGDTVQIVGDDIFVTNTARIIKGLENEVANAAIIKPNQIGTLTETFQAINLCQQAGMNAIVSHRSGETNDSFIADLAVGVSAGQIKAGGCSRGERIAKYNRLLMIEDILTLSMLG